MSKRFTDSAKWGDPWFSDLTPVEKLFWMYLLDNCDHAGIWKVHMKLAAFHLGCEPSLDPFEGRYIELSEEKIFIPGFIDFQYGTLNEANRVHKSVIDRLKKEGAYKALNSPLQRAKEKDKDKDKEKEKDKDSPKGPAYTLDFETFWKLYPNKKCGKQAAFKNWCRAVKSAAPSEIVDAVKDQKHWPDWQKNNGQYIPMATTWLNQGRWTAENSNQGQAELLSRFTGERLTAAEQLQRRNEEALRRAAMEGEK